MFETTSFSIKKPSKLIEWKAYPDAFWWPAEGRRLETGCDALRSSTEVRKLYPCNPELEQNIKLKLEFPNNKRKTY